MFSDYDLGDKLIMTKEKEEHIKSYINKCLKIGIEPISVNDSKLFTHFFEKYKREFHYADSWFYLTQAVNGIGEHAYRLGFKYHVEECLFAIGIFESPHTKKIHFHIVNPIGQNINQHLDDLINMLFNITKTPVHWRIFTNIFFAKCSDFVHLFCGKF